MNMVPIAFCFDDNLEIPAGVCLSSLILNADSGTFYDIFILHSEKSTFPNGILDRISIEYENCKINYRCVGKEFENAFEIREITVATYYRLLIPKLIPEYDKIIYSDVDVIFRSDLSDIYNDTDMAGCYVAGVINASYFDKEYRKHIHKLGLSCEKYIYAGNLIFNSALIRQDNIVGKFINEVGKSSYIFQDMDVINIVCKEKIKRLSPSFCLTTELSKYAATKMQQPLYTLDELLVAQAKGIVHFNGAKPWQKYCINFDIWWEYYRRSPFFDEKYYFNFFYSKLNEYDCLPLWKRVRILMRFFVYGKHLSK